MNWPQPNPERPVVALGLACLDELILWQDIRKGVRDNQIMGFEVQGGGPAATAAVAVARLGGRAEFWGAVGTDWAGDLIIRGLAQEGVDVAGVARHPGQGPLMLVCVDQPTGERYFRHFIRPASPAEPVGQLDHLAGAGCLLVDGTHMDSALRAARRARELGVPTVGDVGGLGPRTGELLALLDVAICSQHVAEHLHLADDPPEACRAVAAMGPARVAITLGAAGVTALADNQVLRLPALPVETVDTTGAGDVFHGAFCFGLVGGLGWADNLAFSSAVAAMKCRRLGGRAGIPTLPQVRQFLQERGLT